MKIVVGHPNVVNHMFTGIGVFSGQYVQPGIAKQFLNDGQIEFNVADPGLFTKEDIVINDRIAKKYIDDYKLGFSRSGNTYTLSTVYSSDNSAVLSNLEDVKISYKNANGTRKLYSNLFWPLDDYPDYEGGLGDVYKRQTKTMKGKILSLGKMRIVIMKDTLGFLQMMKRAFWERI